MGSLSIWHWLVVLFIVLLLFGRGRIADIMGDFAKGIKSFKRGLAEDEGANHPRIAETAPPKPVTDPVVSPPEEVRRS